MKSNTRAFTLIEVLVVVAIIALLMAILLPCLSKARNMAAHTRITSGLRDIIMGYTEYHVSHRGTLLYGYTPATINGVPITVKDRHSGYTFGTPVADRYPWRLAPYVRNMWEILHIHAKEVPPIPQPGDPESLAFTKAYTLSINPTFGINSIYVGGHAGAIFQGFNGDVPNTGKHVVFRENEVHRPGRLLVFAECQARNAPFDDPQTGLHYVMPPYANAARWKAVGDDFELLSSVITGIPKGRLLRRAAVSFFDGHIESLLPQQLQTMSLWANKADRADYDFVR